MPSDKSQLLLGPRSQEIFCCYIRLVLQRRGERETSCPCSLCLSIGYKTSPRLLPTRWTQISTFLLLILIKYKQPTPYNGPYFPAVSYEDNMWTSLPLALLSLSHSRKTAKSCSICCSYEKTWSSEGISRHRVLYGGSAGKISKRIKLTMFANLDEGVLLARSIPRLCREASIHSLVWLLYKRDTIFKYLLSDMFASADLLALVPTINGECGLNTPRDMKLISWKRKVSWKVPKQPLWLLKTSITDTTRRRPNMAFVLSDACIAHGHMVRQYVLSFLPALL